MSGGILMVDESGWIAIANQVAEQIFDYEKDGLLGLTRENLLPHRYRKSHVNFRKPFNADPHRRRDGTEFPVEISLSFTQGKGKLLVMAFIRDISQRKKPEDALKTSEEQPIVYAAEFEKKVELRTEALNNSIA